jgi:AmiR/NasT family two-component response regulator
MNKEQPLRIAVADDEPDMLLFFREVLPRLGHKLVAEAASGKELVQRCHSLHPDLIITDIRMPEGDGLQAVADINEHMRIPVILITAHHDSDVLGRAGGDYIMSYLAKPVKPVDLEAAVRLAMLRFSHFQTLARETDDLRQALEDRKVIERAKGAVMKRVGVGEEEAFRRLRKLASNHNRKLADVAQEIAGSEEVFRLLEKC